MPDFNKDIDPSNFADFDFGFELVDGPPEPQKTEPAEPISVDTSAIDGRLETLENKIGNVLSILSLNDSNDDIKRAIEEQGSYINTAVNEFEIKKTQLEREYERKIEEVENLILPLLVNLTKNPEREYIRWPNRAASVQAQINKILKVTRGNGD